MSGRAPTAPAGGLTYVAVKVNGRTIDADGEAGRFGVEVPLELGANRITAEAEVFAPVDETVVSEGTAEPLFALKSAPVAVTRAPGTDTGQLDRATALMVAESLRSLYWLCGEADGCLARPECVVVSRRRVDCPVKTQFQPEDPATCAMTVSVQLRGRRVHVYTYRCRGRWISDPQSFIRPDIQRLGRRYGADDFDAIDGPNRYGYPRFDFERNRFIP